MRRLHVILPNSIEALIHKIFFAAAAATPRAIAASGTTIVDRIIPSLIANATQQLAPGHANLTITYEAVDR